MCCLEEGIEQSKRFSVTERIRRLYELVVVSRAVGSEHWKMVIFVGIC